MKLRKLLITVFAILFMGFGTAFGQEDEREGQAINKPFAIEDLSNPGIEHNNAFTEFGLQYFLSFGFNIPENNVGSGGNVAIIEQVGVENRAELTQNGSNLFGKIYQEGNLNTALVEQKGNQLISIVSMQGNNNYLDFMQDADNKGAYFQFHGNNMQFNAKQTGSNFSLSHRNSSIPAINIETTRQSLPIIISNH